MHLRLCQGHHHNSMVTVIINSRSTALLQGARPHKAIRLLAIPITIVMGGRHNLAHQAIDHMTGAQVWVVHRTLANTTTTHRGHLLMAAQQLLNDQGLLVRRMETGGRRSGLEYMQAEARRHRLGLCARCCVG